MSKVMREIVYLISSAKTGYFYTTTRNKKQGTEKLKVKKFDPVVKKHVEFTEDKKLSKSKNKKG
ncbi:MAG: 50S ribosomal protein L33 [Bdellovibrionales bacterium]|nr:50S ribosomal protein L33 [Bdellovibrionales bacterium]